MNNPYIVVGTGRSGTSTVARILHNKMGVFMGHEFPPANSTNPDGFWEDIEFYDLNKEFYLGEISYARWKRKVNEVIDKRLNMGKPWGFKDSRMADFIGLYLAFFENPQIIRCERKEELVISSWIRCYGFSEEHAVTNWQDRETMLDNVLSGRDYLTIWFDEKRLTDNEIISLLEPLVLNEKSYSMSLEG